MCKHLKLPSFDVLVSLCQSDPIAYERYRAQILHAEIAIAPPERQEALGKIVETLDTARQIARTPLEAVVIAYSLMCKSLSELNSALHQFQWLTADLEAIEFIDSLRSNSRGDHTRTVG